MDALLEHVLPSLLTYRYIALFAINFLSCLGLPLPAAPSTIAAAAFASKGYLNIAIVVAVAGAANISGDLFMYFLVRKFGIRVLSWIGLKKLIESRAFQNVDRTVDTYKAPVLIFSRFQVQATAIVNIISGLGRMRLKKFALFIAIGELTQVLVYSTIGYTFAESWEAVYAAVGKFSWLVALILATAITIASNKIIKRMLA